MRLATFEVSGRTRVGIVTGERPGQVLDVVAACECVKASRELAQAAGSMETLVAQLTDRRSELEAVVTRARKEAPDAFLERNRVNLCAPLLRPGKIVCLAGNYLEHIAESGYVKPAAGDVLTPQLFIKPSTTLCGDGDVIAIEHMNGAIGWEVELAVVIGQRAKSVSAQAAMQHVLGYTILNDLSERKLNARVTNRKVRELDTFCDWLVGKWFDGFAPCGPWIVTADEISDPHALDMKLSVNGELRQHGSTEGMMFRIPELIEYITSIMTLEPGDIISTGTPVGAGIGGKGKTLEDGDEVSCEIEGIGSIRNPVRRAE
ncbi:MAG: fumarylacetoacetate hydrolase family protein [Kofleriaceae bacterium]